MTGIAKSVGKGGVNQKADAKLVQRLLSPFAVSKGLPPLLDDGDIGPKTIAVIERFQAEVMGFPAPDGRIDPGGKTMAALLAWKVPSPAPTPAPTPTPVPADDGIKVTYGPGVDEDARLVDDYSFAVIRKALGLAGMKAAVITSTLRLPQEQAATMYKNAAKDLNAQFALYGPTGDEILQVYKANRAKSAETVIELMRKTIEKQLANGRQVSKHVATRERYAKLNVIDVGLNSTRAAAGDSFDHKALTKAFARLAEQGYIATFIDETAKSNVCWHVEIVPGAKKL